MGSPRTRARGTVLVASLVFEIIAALFLTAGFFGPGWICETKKQTGLWYSVDYNEDSSGVVKFADIAALRDSRVEAVLCVTFAGVSTGIVPLLRPTSDIVLKISVAIFNVFAGVLAQLASYNHRDDVERYNSDVIQTAPYSTFLFSIGGVFMLLAGAMITGSIYLTFSLEELLHGRKRLVTREGSRSTEEESDNSEED